MINRILLHIVFDLQINLNEFTTSMMKSSERCNKYLNVDCKDLPEVSILVLFSLRKVVNIT